MGKNKFYLELDSYQINLPGRNIVDFKDKEAIRNFVRLQYPKWKDAGQITSIPVARVPRIFLVPDQMTDSMQDHFRSLQKGEEGEIEVYRSLLNASEYSHGILIFPNMDGNHFRCKDAHVEIDLVLIHPRKGVFVFNIKNALNLKEKSLADDMRKHVKFLRHICNYDQSPAPSSIPIHGVICSYLKDVSVKALAGNGYWSNADKNEVRIVLQPADMKTFTNCWSSELRKIPDHKDMENEVFDTFVARLAALNSMEGSLCLIHEKFSSNDMQKIQTSQENAEAFMNNNVSQSLPNNGDQCNEESLNEITNHLQSLDLIKNESSEVSVTNTSMNKNENNKQKKKKVPIILWTKEQLQILSYVCSLFRQPEQKGCRLVVSGPKGSGKTMLLTYLAYLAKKMIESGNVFVLDGRRGASNLLFERLREVLKGTGIQIVSNLLTADQIKNSKVIFVDECIVDRAEDIHDQVKRLDESQHAILFTSSKRFVEIMSSKSITNFPLTNSLRATCSIAKFAEEFRQSQSDSPEFSIKPLHNLEGENVDVRCMAVDHISDPMQQQFVDEVLSSINEIMENSKGLKEILITPYIHPVTLQRIVSRLQQEKYDYVYRYTGQYYSKSAPLEEFFSDNGNFQTKGLIGMESVPVENTGPLPQIIFITGNQVDGSEYGAALLLLERSLPAYWDADICDSLFISLTRATTKLTCIINTTTEPPLIVQKSTPSETEPVFSLPAYIPVVTRVEEYPHELNRIIHDSSWSKLPVLVVGSMPPMPSLSELDPDLFLGRGQNDATSLRFLIRVFQTSDEKAVVVTSIDQLIMVLRAIHNNHKILGFSAIVFFLESQGDFAYLKQKIGRHQLLYQMYDAQITDCPIYMISALPLHPEEQLKNGMGCAIRFFESRMTTKVGSVPVSAPTENASIAQQKSKDHLSCPAWKTAKKAGTVFFMRGELGKAISKYLFSLKMLEKRYEKSLLRLSVTQLITLREELSKLCTNISKVYFDKSSLLENTERTKTLKRSLQYAEKSKIYDFAWRKSYHRIAEARLHLGDKAEAEEAQKKCSTLSKMDAAYKANEKRKFVLREKMLHSPCWELMKFKSNAYLIDAQGNGHFTTIQAALDKHGRANISLLINPGEYDSKFHRPIGEGENIDIVGNWSTGCSFLRKVITVDPPIVLHCEEGNTFDVRGGTLSLTKVSITNTDRRTSGHAIYIACSTVTILECAFQSYCAAAVAATSGCNLTINCSRSIGTYGAVLVDGGGESGFTTFPSIMPFAFASKVVVSNCDISETKVLGLEFRNGDGMESALVENCRISRCERQGIGCVRFTTTIKSCELERNSFGNTVKEGSIQLTDSKVVVSDTSIQNQIGNGIVIEGGKGVFKGLDIDRCMNTGILIQAPAKVENCRFRNCYNAFGICAHIPGDVVLDNNVISHCRCDYHILPNARKPIVIDEKENPKREMVDKFLEETSGFRSKMESGQRAYERKKRLKKWLKANISASRHLVDGPHETPACSYCTLMIQYENIRDSVLCEKCESEIYCSVLCRERDRQEHDYHCKFALEVMKIYETSLSAAQ